MPQPTIAKPIGWVWEGISIDLRYSYSPRLAEGTQPPASRGLYIQKHRGLPHILDAAEQGNDHHRPDQDIAHAVEKEVPRAGIFGHQKRHEHGDDGGALQSHLELAQPVRPEARPMRFHPT